MNRYTYDIWGNPETTEETIPNVLRYAGEDWDDVTGLQYLRARWYDPSTARFINEDTVEGELKNPLSLNLYTYVENNPLIYVDFSGESKRPAKNSLEGLGAGSGSASAGAGRSSGGSFGGGGSKGGGRGGSSSGSSSSKPSTSSSGQTSQGTGKINNVYDSIKKAPKYPEGFKGVQNGTKKVNVNNKDVLEQLRNVESGQWKKVYKDGYNASGKEVSIHYFESASGKVFDVKVKFGWSNN